ncbi:L,D-transpeptidase family protein [Afifella sp. JA880]|uniref:L,D-transpeptidase n=1 Tax=Afifella sp. JA880 TaxID=2975280 RepID=UPI0021BA457D|nr:L,D-transpeptidase family protein [Afifella sp. JA880]MCT8267083.1 L,D-transpeptidase family protein [Afifella sp. JA880]
MKQVLLTLAVLSLGALTPQATMAGSGGKPSVPLKAELQQEWLSQLAAGPAQGAAARPIMLADSRRPQVVVEKRGLLQVLFDPQPRAQYYAQPQRQLYAQPQRRLYAGPQAPQPQPRAVYRSRNQPARFIAPPPTQRQMPSRANPAGYPTPVYLRQEPRAVARPAPRQMRPVTPVNAPRVAPAAPQVAARPAARSIDPAYLPTIVDYDTSQAPGTIVIDTNNRYLYLVQAGGKAKRYGVGVGRPGFQWAGTHKVTRKAEWPSWYPPEEMKARQPGLPDHMEGGPDNPLGARALYLGSTLYRIHGSNQPWTIGHAVSSGCIRMRNEDVIELYNQVGVGTEVVVL